MTRRATTLVVALGLLIALVGVARFVKVPYVILLPGPVTDTLGNVPAVDTADGRPGGPVISISGARTQPTSGHLYLTTVSESPGSCDTHPTLWQTVKAWFSSTQTVEPSQVQCPPGQSTKQVQREAQRQMSESQIHAVVAAFTELGYKSTGNRVEIASVRSGVPAASQLQRGDVIQTVDGKSIRSTPQLQTVVQDKPAGSPIAMSILRNNAALRVRTTTVKSSQGTPVIGINVRTAPTFNGVVATIGIDPNVIGGPSAGAALALGIVDKLTPGGLTGGRTIAGTGTVSDRGLVGPIGGIQQKVAAASAAHATVFFAPAAECGDAKSAAPSSMTLVSVRTLHDAVTSLRAIKAGSDAFPHC
jgi:PDZ domain-containing protein